MDFLAPLMLLGAIGLAIPVLIHLIGRRRAKMVRFAALDFLLGSNRKTARRFRLREIVLLLVRVLICLAIPLALAKPFTSCHTRGPMVERGPQAAVIIIDNSFAASYRMDGQSLLARAREQAQSIISQLGPEAELAILLGAEGADSPTELSRDHLRSRDAVRRARASARPADLTTALRRAAQLLAASSHERRIVYLLSPMEASGFRPDEQPWPPGSGPALVVIDLTDGKLPHNLAITSMSVDRDPGSGSRGIRVTTQTANFGSSPVKQHGISLLINDISVARGFVSVEPGERQSKQFLAALPPGGRFADVVVALDDDPLLVDNRRYAHIELRDEVRVLLINGDPHTVRHEDELFYLEAALRPGDRGDSGTTLTTATVDELPKLRLGEFDVVVLANVRAISADRVAPLAKWVQGGGGLLLAPGDNVDADAYNRTMQPLLPQAFKSVVDVAYGTSGQEKSERAVRLTQWKAEHPIFSIFSREAPGLREARFAKIMLLGPTTRVDDRRVLARYTNGAAALVEARSGEGRLLLATSTLDRDWNDLSIHPGYLPLMQQAVRYLARKHDQRPQTPILAGRSALVPVGARDTTLEIHPPTAARTVIEGKNLLGRKYVRFTDTDEPGFYRVLAADEGGDSLRRMEADFAVNVDPRGSDLRPVEARLLPASGSALASAGGQPAHKRRVELWHALAVGLLLLLLIESLLTLR